MDVALLIPNDGLLECFLGKEHMLDEKADQLFTAHGCEGPYVKVDLHRDDVYCGQVMFSLATQVYNQRAVDAVAFLSGTYVTIAGAAILTDISEKTAMGLIERLSQS